jgi:hypothetical protein
MGGKGRRQTADRQWSDANPRLFDDDHASRLKVAGELPQVVNQQRELSIRAPISAAREEDERGLALSADGKDRADVSGCCPDRDLPLADAFGHLVKCLLDVLGLQVGKGIDDIGGGHAISEHVDDCGHRDAETSYARESAHLVGICGDAVEPHGVLASMAVVCP